MDQIQEILTALPGLRDLGEIYRGGGRGGGSPVLAASDTD